MQMLLNQKPRLRLLLLFNQVALRVASRREGARLLRRSFANGDVKRTQRKRNPPPSPPVRGARGVGAFSSEVSTRPESFE